ncbi:MAG: hypothetical protein ABIH35_00565 [Patescibacteria group bacterium]
MENPQPKETVETPTLESFTLKEGEERDGIKFIKGTIIGMRDCMNLIFEVNGERVEISIDEGGEEVTLGGEEFFLECEEGERGGNLLTIFHVRKVKLSKQEKADPAQARKVLALLMKR